MTKMIPKPQSLNVLIYVENQFFELPFDSDILTLNLSEEVPTGLLKCSLFFIFNDFIKQGASIYRYVM